MRLDKNQILRSSLGVLCALVLAACGDSDTDTTAGSDSDGSESTNGTTAGGCADEDPTSAPLDESACQADANDYMPTVNGSADDVWPACENDDGTYHPFEQPSAAARTEAFEEIMVIFNAGLTPTDFTAARDQYSLPQGLESRLSRREDVHYPNIPVSEQDAGVEFDKQCTVLELREQYPDRCAGPMKIQPIINQAFDDGQNGVGDPMVNAAKVEGAITWFLYPSVIKEATFSCPPADYSGDCDAAWGYYGGGQQAGGAIGFGGFVKQISSQANQRVFDGLAAMRCWRNGYMSTEDGDVNDPLYGYGKAQLDQANNHALALVVRERMADQFGLCGSEADANWAFVQTAGQGLIKPAEDTDAGNAGIYTSLLANDNPSGDEIMGGIAALDALFPCP